MRARGPDDPHPEPAGAVDVVDEAPRAAQEPRVLDAPHGAADVRHGARGSVRAGASAAARTASRIDW